MSPVGRRWCVALTIAALVGGITVAGPGDTRDEAAASVAVPTTLAVGDDFGCAIDAQAQVLCWGSNARGQLGVGRDPAELAASPFIARATGITADSLSARGQHACVVRAGSVLCWGEGAFGQTGDPQRRDSPSPAEIAGLTDIVQVATAGGFACALDEGGAVWCWGANGARQFGAASPTWSAVPLRVVGVPAAVDLAVGGRTACVVTRTAGVYCWGNGAAGARVNVPPATQVAVSAGAVCALVLGGEVRCWGNGLLGQLGHGSFGTSAFPTGVLGLWDATDIAAGTDTFCARASGAALGLRPGVRCWGKDAGGQLDTGLTAVSMMVQVVDEGTLVPGEVDVCWRDLESVVRCRGTAYGAGWVRIGGPGGASPPQPPGAPGLVTITAVTATTARVAWQPPAIDGAQITEYAVTVTSAGDERQVVTTEPALTLDGLPAGRRVDVAVSALTRRGAGEQTSTSFTTLRRAPVVRLGARTTTSVRLTWAVAGDAAVRWRRPGGDWRAVDATRSGQGALVDIPVGSRGTPITVDVRVDGYETAHWRGATAGLVSPRLRLVDAQGRPLPGAQIDIDGRRVRTSTDGTAVVPRIQAGWHSMRVSATLSSRIRTTGSTTVALAPGRTIIRLPEPPSLRTTTVALVRNARPLVARLTTNARSVRRDGFTFTIRSTEADGSGGISTDEAGRAVVHWFAARDIAPPADPAVLFVGDSHLYPMIPALRRLSEELGVSSHFMWQFGCPWVSVTTGGTGPGDVGRPCGEVLVGPMLWTVQQVRPTLVVLVSRSIVKQDIRSDGTRLEPGAAAWVDVVRERTTSVVRELVDLGVDVAVVEPLPEVEVAVNRCLLSPQWQECSSPPYFQTGTDEWRSVVRALARIPEVTTVSLAPVFCGAASCPAAVGGIPVRRDDNHPTPEFALAARQGILEQFRAAGVDLAGAHLTVPALTITSSTSAWTIDLQAGPLAVDVADLPPNRRAAP